MPTILIVDDRAINRQFLGSLLGIGGYAVIEAEDGVSALQAVAMRRPDAIITDVAMPNMDGVELSRRLKSDPTLAEVPVIFYTATYKRDESGGILNAPNVARVLPKPSDPEVILAAVAEVLAAINDSSVPTKEPGARRSTATLDTESRGERLRERIDNGLRLISRHGDVSALPPAFTDVQTLSLRVSALLEFGLELGTQRDIKALLELSCRAAQEILAAQHVCLAILDSNGRSLPRATRGIPSGADVALCIALEQDQALLQALRDNRSFRPQEVISVGTAALPTLRNVLVTPIRTGSRHYGWMCVAERPDASTFDDSDEQVAVTLAMQLANAYENLSMWAEATRHAEILQAEIAHREVVEARNARLSRINTMLSGVNASIMRLREGEALYREACRIAVADGGFGMACIVPCVRHADDGMVFVCRSEVPDSQGDGGTSDARAAWHADFANWLRTMGHPLVINDLALGALPTVLRAALLAQRYQAMATFPLYIDAQVSAVLCLLAQERDMFDDAERELLTELAGDVSFGLQYIDREQQVNYLAYYDPLTGIPNRTLYMERLAQFISAARHADRQLAVVLLNIDHFKQVNDIQGRHVGDELLRTLAKCWRETLPEPMGLARVGGDIFAAVLTDLPASSDAAILLQEHLVLPLAKLPPIRDQEIQPTVTAGIAVFPEDGDEPDVLMQHAEAALSQAKSQALPHRHYDSALDALAVERLALERSLKSAIATNQFIMHYQPRVSLLNGAIVGAEALIRWPHPQGGMIPPAKFIPLAEETGLIGAIGNWVLETVFAQQASWIAKNLDVVPIAINLSAVQFNSSDIIQRLSDGLKAHALEAQHVELELTESAVMRDPEGATSILNAIRGLGLKLSLDDFGTGNSSLAYLRRFPFDFLKIDRSFVTDITHNADDAKIATSIIALAHQLRLHTVAEGVETEGQLNFLRQQGCDEIQGYYFSRPIPADEFERLLREGRRLHLAQTPEVEKRTLLIVDDEPSTLAALRRALRQDGYELLTAESGLAALELLALHKVQVIVSDQRMPTMSGIEFLSTAKELYPDTVRIILTGYTELEAVTDAVNRGAVFKFLTKPWDDELLREQIRDAFKRYRPS